MTWFLIGAAIGLAFAAVIVAGYRRGRTIYMRQFVAECREFGCHDDDLDFYQEFIEAVHFAQWEQDLEDQEDQS
jgi:hypothetical protein